MLGRISPVEAPGWGIVVQRPADLVPAAVNQMVINTIISSGTLILLALVIAALATRKVSRPIQELADTTHEIAEGKFDKRVEVLGPSREFHELASDFNRMSGHLQDHVDQLRAAAQANRELFIGSMRSFVAAIDAKDPYTAGTRRGWRPTAESSPSIWDFPVTNSTASGSVHCCTMSARSASRTASCARVAS